MTEAPILTYSKVHGFGLLLFWKRSFKIDFINIIWAGEGAHKTCFFSFSPFYQNPCEASSRSRIFLFSLVNMWLCLSVCTAPFGHKEKRYRPEIWYTYSHWPYLKMFFLFFRKKWLWGPLASKNCRVTWIFRISPRLPCWKLYLYSWVGFHIKIK